MKKILIFCILLLAASLRVHALENGFYIIRSAINRNYVIDNSGSCLNNGNNIQLWEINWTGAQKWFVANHPDGTVSFTNLSVLPNPSDESTYHMLDLNGSDIYLGNNIHLWTLNGTKAQIWYLRKNSDGTYTIQSSINRNFVVDLSGSKIFNGNNIQLWEDNGTNAQRWIFEKTKPM